LGPALLPENLADKPNYILVGAIKYGRETLAMPPWDGILTTAEIEWLVVQLKQGNFTDNNGEKK
ncbi:MAG: cytochrome c, partial [Oleispira sp.]|nr:cytochrome c [Oleispira sp.]MBL4880646.1 cytochrome c [Oleispira sp.]